MIVFASQDFVLLYRLLLIYFDSTFGRIETCRNVVLEANATALRIQDHASFIQSAHSYSSQFPVISKIKVIVSYLKII